MIRRRRNTFGLNKSKRFIDKTRRRVARKCAKKSIVNRRIKQINTAFEVAHEEESYQY